MTKPSIYHCDLSSNIVRNEKSYGLEHTFSNDNHLQLFSGPDSSDEKNDDNNQEIKSQGCSILFDNYITLNNPSKDKSSENVIIDCEKPLSDKSEHRNNDSSSSVESFLKIPRNHIIAYKVFRNSTFKFVSFNGKSLIKKVNCNSKLNDSKYNNTMDIYVNKNMMMNKINELAAPYYSGKKPFYTEFKRIIPHPIIDDKRFKPSFDEALSADNNSLLGSKRVFIQSHENNNSIDIDKKVLSSNENSTPLKYVQKYETIDAIKMIKDSIVSLDEVLKSKQTPIKSKVYLTCSFNTPKQCCQSVNSGNPICNSGHPQPSKIMSSLRTSVIKKDLKESISKESNIQIFNEIEVYLEDPNNGNGDFLDNNKHIQLFFKCDSGKKLRFKIRNFSQMSQAFKAFYTRMNVDIVSELHFKTSDGRMVSHLDTPRSLNLNPDDIIVVSGF